MMQAKKQHGGSRPGSGRKSTGEKVSINLRVDKASVLYLRSIGYRFNADVNAFIADLANKKGCDR